MMRKFYKTVPGGTGKAVWLLLLLALFYGPVKSQLPGTRQVTGVVKDDSTFLTGVTIATPDRAVQTQTNASGLFVITVPVQTTSLLFSMVGYRTTSINLSANHQLSVTLSRESKELEQVIVVGYGTQRKVNLTGAVD
jgi:hypothetical protein